jgi:curved DNA-binding protein CbpA
VPSLTARLADGSSFDPHTVLGVPSAASIEDIKAAWHRLSKVYHPDRYQAADLPPEVRDYLAAMARRINAAYSALENAHLASRRVQSGRATPIYTSAPR